MSQKGSKKITYEVYVNIERKDMFKEEFLF